MGEIQVVRSKFVRRAGADSGDGAVVAWAAILVLAAVAMAIALVVSGFGVTDFAPTLALAVVALIAERQSVRLSPNLEISVSFLPFILAAALSGPLAAMLVGAVSLASQFGKPHIRWVVWTASRALVCGAAGVAAWAAGGSSADSFTAILEVVVAASVTEVFWDLTLGAATVSIRRTGSLLGQLRTTMPILLAAVPLYTPVAAVLAYAYRVISPWTLVFFVIPAFAAHWLFTLYREQRATAVELTSANERLETANLSFAIALVATLDARDRYTAGHSAAVAVYARDIAARMGMSSEGQRLAHLCGLVHDIGKVGLPAGLLEKPGPLTLEERRVMETHSAIGEKILANVKDYAEIAAIVRHHHERVDGQGYPDGLTEDEIPLLARIIAVADAYNAMTSDRPYRDAMPSQVARLRLAQAVTSQFDTAVVAAFEAILAGATESYRRGESDAFALERRQQHDREVVPIAALASA
jgi:putative nucleotidyltransferase with HDIG domain